MPIPQHMDIALNGHRFRLLPAPADVGSWLLMQMMNTLMRVAEKAARMAPAPTPDAEVSYTATEPAAPAPEAPKPPQIPAEVQTLMAVNEMLGSLSRKRFREMQMLALEQTMRITDEGGREVALPITMNGAIVDPVIATDGALALNLTTKALVFILSPSTGAGADQQQ